IARHLSDEVRIHRVESGMKAHTRCSMSRLAAGVSGPYHDDIVLFIEHTYFPTQKLEKMRSNISSVTTSPVNSSKACKARYISSSTISWGTPSLRADSATSSAPLALATA